MKKILFCLLLLSSFIFTSAVEKNVKTNVTSIESSTCKYAYWVVVNGKRLTMTSTAKMNVACINQMIESGYQGYFFDSQTEATNHWYTTYNNWTSRGGVVDATGPVANATGCGCF